MQLCNDIDLSTITTLAIGGFDGIHLGHKALIDKLGSDGAILVIEGYNSDLTPSCIRSVFTDKNIIILALDKVRDFEAEEFIDYLKSRFLKLNKIIVGYDFRFGKNRAYDSRDLAKLFEKEVEVVDEVKQNSISIHSTYIRKLIRSGGISTANSLLGHNYMIAGEIISGQGLGMRRLFPTLNLEIRKFLIPSEGVYATLTKVDNKLFKSVSFIGHRVTTDGSFAVESHIIDSAFIESDSKTVQIFFVDLIRNNKKFSDLTSLKTAIANDIKKAKNILEKEQV